MFIFLSKDMSLNVFICLELSLSNIWWWIINSNAPSVMVIETLASPKYKFMLTILMQFFSLTDVTDANMTAFTMMLGQKSEIKKHVNGSLEHLLVTLRKYTRATWRVGSCTPPNSFPTTEGSFLVCATPCRPHKRKLRGSRRAVVNRRLSDRKMTVTRVDQTLRDCGRGCTVLNTAELLHQQGH